MNPIIRAECLTKTYGNNNVINNVSLQINEGDFTAIIGPSGSGKSTLLYLLSGLEKPTSGNVIYKDLDFSEMTDGKLSQLRLNNFGFIFQFYNLIDSLTVLENISFPLCMRGESIKAAQKTAIIMAERVGLKDKIYKYPHQLSGGEQQRVSIARALSINASVVFADEPTGNLDTAKGIEIMELLAKIHEETNTTILMVTHNENLLNYFKKTIKISDGKIY